MKIKLLTYAISFIISISSVFSQNSVTPKNISQAVLRLKIETPDSLKKIVKKTDDKDLLSLLYPPYEQYFKCINLWINDDRKPRITKYFLKRGISDGDHQRLIILTAFKQDLL